MQVTMKIPIVYLILKNENNKSIIFLGLTAFVAVMIIFWDFLEKQKTRNKVRRIAKEFMLTVLVAGTIGALDDDNPVYDFTAVLVCTGFIVYYYWFHWKKYSKGNKLQVSQICKSLDEKIYDYCINNRIINLINDGECIILANVQFIKIIDSIWITYVKKEFSYDKKKVTNIQEEFCSTIDCKNKICYQIFLMLLMKIVTGIGRFIKKIILGIFQFALNNLGLFIMIILSCIVIFCINRNLCKTLLIKVLWGTAAFIKSLVSVSWNINWALGCMLVPLIVAESFVIEILIKKCIFKLVNYKNEKEIKREEKQKLLLIRKLMVSVIIPGLVDISRGSMELVMLFTILSGLTIVWSYWYE